MKEYYTVGETAKMFDVSTDTLRYYDKLDLIKPWYTGENGYRYYSKAQFEMMSNILMLARLGTPLKKIRTILRSADTGLVLNELKSYAKTIDEKIKHLENMKAQSLLLSKAIDDCCRQSEIKVVTIPSLYLLIKEYDSKTDEFNIEEIIEANRSTDNEWSSFASVISTADKNEVQSGNFHVYKSYGYMSEYPCHTKRKDLLHIIKDGRFVVAGAKVTNPDHSDIDAVYNKMLKYIYDNKLTIKGDVIERNVFDLYRENGHELTIFFEIYIPV